MSDSGGGITINSYGTLNFCVPDTQVLGQVLDKLNILVSKEVGQSVTIDELKAQVERNTNPEDSAIQLIQGIAQQLRDAQGDPNKIAELSTQLSVGADALAAAISANTPPSAQRALADKLMRPQRVTRLNAGSSIGLPGPVGAPQQG